MNKQDVCSGPRVSVSPLVSRRLSCSSAAGLVRLLSVGADTLQLVHHHPRTLIQDQLDDLNTDSETQTPQSTTNAHHRFFFFDVFISCFLLNKPAATLTTKRLNQASNSNLTLDFGK